MQPPYYFVFPKMRSKVLFELADYHAKEGIIRKEQIENAESGDSLETHMGKTAYIYHATTTDIIESFRNGPQNITLKDASYIIGRCGITTGSKVIEAGTGSGSLTAYLAVSGASVASFEMREDFHALAAKNLARLEGLETGKIELHNAPLEEAQGIVTERFDVCILDMPEPWTCYEAARTLLAPGGHLVCYVPNATQASQCAQHAAEFGFEPLESVEIIRREWRFTERIAKPSKEVMHTAFLLVFRASQGTEQASANV